jgi:hypothetical protein
MAVPTLAATPIAVLGDSDSAGYQDTLSFAPGSSKRGGDWRHYSLQWTEVLARLRQDQLDLGPREPVGMAGWQARLWHAWRASPRAPRKFDHRHNFAISGAGCTALVDGAAPQTAALRALMAETPERWRTGIVVIRIGINDLGTRDLLDQVAAGNTTDSEQRRQSCLNVIEGSVQQLQDAQPGLRIVLVGLFDNAHWAPQLSRWRDPTALARLDAHAERFDAGLRELAARTGALFFDDRQWFRQHWGSRDADGHPDYSELHIGAWRVANTQGDAPHHASLGDGHAGTLWNALWANALIDTLNASGNHPVIAPLSEQEILSLLPNTPTDSDSPPP